jgi:hypothetical protein
MAVEQGDDELRKGAADDAAAPIAPETPQMQNRFTIKGVAPYVPSPPGEAHEIEPNRWELFLAGDSCCGLEEKVCRAPCCACWLFFGIGWIFVFVFLTKIMIVGDEILDFDEPVIKSDEDVQNWYAFQALARSAKEGCVSNEMQDDKDMCEDDSTCEWNRAERACQFKNVCPSPPPLPRTQGMGFFAILYEAKGETPNLLDDGNLDLIAKFEREVLTNSNGAEYEGKASPWTDWCSRIYLNPSDNSSEWRCNPPYSMLNMLTTGTPAQTKVKEQIEAGWTWTGSRYGCFCSHEDAACSVCNGLTRTPKPEAEWPADVKACFAAARRLQTADDNDNTTDYCQGRRFTPTDQQMAGMLCSSSHGLNCQWAAPGVHSFCSSKAFYHPTDSGALLKGAEKKNTLNKMCDEKYLSYWDNRKASFSVNFDCGAKEVKFARTMFLAGSITGSESESEEFEKGYMQGRTGWFQSVSALEREIEDESDQGKGKTLRIMLFASPVFFSQMLDVLLTDGLLSISSLVLVWLWMWFSLESAFLASCGIFEIIFSLPVGMSVWAVVANQKIFFQQFLVIYMILGIGADDVFIVFDAWEQAALAGPDVNRHYVTRFAFAYRRSFWAMMCTTMTTCGSFLIGVFSPLPTVSAFCIFAAIVVFVDWVFCVTFFAAAVLVYEKKFRGKICCCCCPAMKPAGKVCGPGCCWGATRFALTCNGNKWKIMTKPPAPGEPPEKRALEKFCSGPLYRFLAGIGGKVLLVVWFIFVILGAVNAGLNLRTAERPPPIGREHIDVTYVLDVLLNEFPNWRQPKTYAVFGLKDDGPVEWGSKHDKDKAVFDAAAARGISTKQGQLDLLKLCRSADVGKDAKKTRCDEESCIVKGSSNVGLCARNELIWKQYGVYVSDDIDCLNGRYCFMEEFARFWASQIDDCPRKKSMVSCSGTCGWDSTLSICYATKTEFDYPGLDESDFIAFLGGRSIDSGKQNTFEAYMAKRKGVLEQVNRVFDYSLYEEMTAVMLTPDKTKIKAAYIGWNTTYALLNTGEEANEIYDHWEAHMSDYAGNTGGYQTTELYLFRATQNEMVKGAILGIVLSLVVAYVVMLATAMNWWTASIGLINILSIVAVFLGLLPAIGWQLGEYECIFMIATVGLSVDYTVHLLHAYNHARKAGESMGRLEKAEKALDEMGISVLNSAITTLLAALILFLCGFYFFFQFGAFIFIVIGLSILTSLTLLMPLLMVAGPNDSQGSIRHLIRAQAAPKVAPGDS